MRRISTPNFNVWRPRTTVKLSIQENEVPTSVSSAVSLTPSNVPGLTATGEVPYTKL
jgi:hypothetical protein